MKIEWINNGAEFELPKKTITVEDTIEILNGMETNTKDLPQTEIGKIKRNLAEFTETLYWVFRKIDKNITRDIIKQNTTVDELGVLYALVRTNGQLSYNCPHCKKSFLYSDLIKQDEKGNETNFHKSKKEDITVTKGTS